MPRVDIGRRPEAFYSGVGARRNYQAVKEAPARTWCGVSEVSVGSSLRLRSPRHIPCSAVAGEAAMDSCQLAQPPVIALPLMLALTSATAQKIGLQAPPFVGSLERARELQGQAERQPARPRPAEPASLRTDSR